ncbi:hypothetical protein FJ987_29335 [Mesorhizobium sp. CU2]|uniref:hypothetical protein n=1 Tax=unclassified Mesorhizobium TaxID=325217 RepID=UPI00112D1450|nr:MULTISPECIES: hypothetical protein [unclassified Mesorhizobium]TPN79518.1 hypothetical protein FJ988_22640 [Mesorhizobium sp. CU3]TPO02066.1 hypothetical protein FJ987_29335 [Mesorhizobium sp. CU2]
MRGKSAVLGLLLVSTIVATTPGAAVAEQSGSWTVTGKCKRLIVRNEKLTEACTGEVTQIRNADGTVTFRFSDGRNWLLFRGKQASIRLLRGYKTVIDLDGVAFGKIGAEPLFQELASAACNYAAPYRGEAYISCSAILNFQMWAATIETDGRLPIPDNEYIPPTLSAP